MGWGLKKKGRCSSIGSAWSAGLVDWVHLGYGGVGRRWGEGASAVWLYRGGGTVRGVGYLVISGIVLGGRGGLSRILGDG